MTWLDIAATLVGWIVLCGTWSAVSLAAEWLVDNVWRRDGIRIIIGP